MTRSSLVLDANDALAARIGAHGLSASDLDALSPAAARAWEALSARWGRGELGFWKLPSDEAIQAPAIAVGEELAERFENVVVLGIGGSSLGAKSAVAALGGPFRDLLPRERRQGARVFFPDNSDPDTFASLLDCIDLGSTCFLAITKSGGTAETLSQLMIVRERLGESRLAQQLVAITDPETGALRQLAREQGWRTLPVPPDVGGRYSVLSAVGLTPIAAAGFDAAALCRGAAAMRRRCESPTLRENPALLLAAIHHAFDRRGRRVHVLFPYSDALREFGDWFVQLWAESLGKSEEAGPTPLRAVGATDQHSLLQLLMEGPQDKLVTFLAVEEPVADVAIPPVWSDRPAFELLAGRSLGGLLDAERRGTTAALAQAGRPSLTLRLPRVDAQALGELYFLWEAATAFAGTLYGVDPFDQPGVEASKRLTKALMAGEPMPGALPPEDPAFVLR
ncbi:MAG TPA: hypothetical protein VN033_09490 [Vulgatibacter sp.]|nr:hypothetical protein [Vulgatibacter sp.]